MFNFQFLHTQRDMLLLTEENTFLQEALRKNRVELENEKRQHKSLKQNKVRPLLFPIITRRK